MTDSTASMTELSRELLIINKRGLHARASAKFVQTVEAYDAAITVSKDGTTVGGTLAVCRAVVSTRYGVTEAINPAKAP